MSGPANSWAAGSKILAKNKDLRIPTIFRHWAGVAATSAHRQMSGGLGRPGELGDARAAKIVGGLRRFYTMRSGKKPQNRTKHGPNVSETYPFSAEKWLTRPASLCQAVIIVFDRFAIHDATSNFSFPTQDDEVGSLRKSGI
jgi:hypothetical protein